MCVYVFGRLNLTGSICVCGSEKLAGSICVYVFGSFFGMVVEFDKKKKKVCWKEMIKARERYLTGSF